MVTPPPADPGHPEDLYGLLPHETEQRRPFHRRIMLHLRGRMMAGVLVFLPILVTYFIFRFVFDLIGSLLDPIVLALGLSDGPPWLLNTIEFVIIIGIIYIAGLLIRRRIAKLVIDAIHDAIARIPVIGTVYNTTRIGIDFLSDSQRHTYRGVVLIEFPRPGVMSIGLITSNLGLLNEVDEYLSIYVPTTPVPSSGYLVVVPASQVIPTDISVDEAMRTIISGGILAGDIFANRTVRINPTNLGATTPDSAMPGNSDPGPGSDDTAGQTPASSGSAASESPSAS